jgi:hypothetical protein
VINFWKSTPGAEEQAAAIVAKAEQKRNGLAQQLRDSERELTAARAQAADDACAHGHLDPRQRHGDCRTGGRG